jgi:hypothetical protein
LRLSTVGSEVLEGNGLGVSEGEAVSVAISVGVSEAVSAGAGGVTVSVMGENAVFVGVQFQRRCREQGRCGIAGKRRNINKMEKLFRLIGVYSPFRIAVA